MPVRRTATQVPDVTTWNGATLVSVSDAVALIANRDHRDDDDRPSDASNRARSLLADHLRKGTLVLADARSRRLRAGELGRFLRARFPDKFNDVPADVVIDVPTATMHMRPGTVNVMVLPHTIDNCHAEILRLGRELDAANARIAELEPLALRRKAQAGQNQRNGSKGGRPKKVLQK